MSRKASKSYLKLLHDVAHEAHIMGRVYQKGGEVRSPGEEWARVDAMVTRFLLRVEPAKTKRKRP